MTRTPLERSLRTGGLLVAAGIVVELLSFLWNHPLAFIVFGLLGGSLIGAGVFVFLSTVIRRKTWSDPVGEKHGD